MSLHIRNSPHVAAGHGVPNIMMNVVLALLPTTLFSIYAFGLVAVFTLGTAVLSCMATEHVLARFMGKPSPLRDNSALVTGLLYGLTLPPGLALWMVAVGGVIAVGIGKSMFGGLGMNPFNPALVGRAVLQAAFPVAMTTWVDALGTGRFTSLPSSSLALPFTKPAYQAVTGATPLSAWKFDHQAADTVDLLMGFTSGSTGETAAALVLLGGLYLVARNMMNWRITATILATVALFSGALWLVDPTRFATPQFMLLSGGLMLGATFMATDMVGSPMTTRGVLLYGALIGVLVVVIRTWGGMPEGVMYAILLGNAVTPLLDNWLRPTVYGTGRPGRDGTRKGAA